jgi:glycosyltransferase involved in cell wall biosynthesis
MTKKLAKGVNIFGFPEFALGIGEDARMASLALQSAGWNSAFIKIPLNCTSNKIEKPAEILVHKKPSSKYNIDLFCLPPTEMIRLAIEGGMEIIESKRYKIGAWPWELPFWPKNLSNIKFMVDEVWAQSDYVFNCFSQLDNLKVYKIPMAVEIGLPQKIEKKLLGVSVNTYVFYSMFDGNSRLARKNPLGSLRAFERAFPDKNENVALFIKVMNVSPDNEAWKILLKFASKDPRIHIFNQYLSSQELLNFISSCDALISLHRSEGFGRVLAEAMLLNQPVVATKFSGNLDFCTKDTSYLVDGELIPVRKGEYLFYEDQYWMDPDIDLAALEIRKVVDDNNQRLTKIQNAYNLIRSNHSIHSVGLAYRTRVEAISNI